MYKIVKAEKEMKCCLCKGDIAPQENGWAIGHNAEPLADGRCCDDCNYLVLMHRTGLIPLPDKKD